jgi:predicted RNase H-like nuclease
MIHVGLDLAWSPRNRTGVAVLHDCRLVAYSGVLTGNDAILAFVEPYLQRGESAIIAVDAPLRVPNKTGARLCDRELSLEWRHYEAGALPANRQLLAINGEVRGETLVTRFAQQYGFVESAPLPKQAEGRYICEIYPHPAQVYFFGLEKTLKYKARAGRTHDDRLAEFTRYQQLLAALQRATPPLLGTEDILSTDLQRLRGRALKAYEDTLDAIVCAYTGAYLWQYGPEATRVYGSVAEGHILTPLPVQTNR